MGIQHEAFGRNGVFIPLLFILIGIFLGMRETRFRSSNSISLKTSINNGVKISAINAVIMSAFIYIYYTWIDPGFFTHKINEALVLMKSNGNTPEEIKEYILTAKIIFSPGKLSSFTLFGYLMLGIIYSAVCGLLLQKIPVLSKTD